MGSTGLDEGAHADPGGNLVRFGSPPDPPRAERFLRGRRPAGTGEPADQA